MRRDAMFSQEDRASSAKQEDSRELSRQFGHRILRLRKRKEWSRQELARMLGIEKERLTKWEQGINQPSLEQVAQLGGLFGVTLDELITGKPFGPSLTPAELEKLARRVEAMRQWLQH